jgi:hypothetical protein
MKLKDIVPYCLDYAQKPGGSFYEIKYYWIIKNLTYQIQSFQTYAPTNLLDHDYYYHPYTKFSNEQNCDSFITLSRYKKYNFSDPLTYDKHDEKNDCLTLNLNNEITIFDKFIMVHKTDKHTTDSENDLFFKTNYFIAHGHDFSAQMYNIGLYGGGMATNLRGLFKDLINPPVPSKPAELTLDEKVDDLIDELMKDSRTMAIKKLKRMLNERL